MGGHSARSAVRRDAGASREPRDDARWPPMAARRVVFRAFWGRQRRLTMPRIAGATLPAQKTRKDDHTYHPIMIEGTKSAARRDTGHHKRRATTPGAAGASPAYRSRGDTPRGPPGPRKAALRVAVPAPSGVAGAPPAYGVGGTTPRAPRGSRPPPGRRCAGDAVPAPETRSPLHRPSTLYHDRMVRVIVFSRLLGRKHRAGDAGHRQAALTPPKGAKSDPSGGHGRPSDVVARLS